MVVKLLANVAPSNFINHLGTYCITGNRLPQSKILMYSLIGVLLSC
jgi:hypothetical protein